MHRFIAQLRRWEGSLRAQPRVGGSSAAGGEGGGGEEMVAAAAEAAAEAAGVGEAEAEGTAGTAILWARNVTSSHRASHASSSS